MPTKQSTLRLPEDLKAVLRTRAERNRRTLSGEIQFLCETAIRAEEQANTGAGA